MKRKTIDLDPLEKSYIKRVNKTKNIKFSQIEAIKKFAATLYIKNIKENPSANIKFSNIKHACSPILIDMLNKYSKKTKDNESFDILFSKSEGIFLNKIGETIDQLIKFSGIVNDMSTEDIKKYKLRTPKEVSYKEHRDYLSEALPGEKVCMHKDKRSIKSQCRAQIDHGITLRVGPRYSNIKKYKIDPLTSMKKVYYEDIDGICIYCERYMIDFLFNRSKKKNINAAYVLNKYTYPVDVIGEYKKEYMLSQMTPNPYGVIHHYPKFNKNNYFPAHIKRIVRNKEFTVRGLIEKEKCFFK